MRTKPTGTFDVQDAIENVYYNYKGIALSRNIEFYILSDLVSRCKVTANPDDITILFQTVFENAILHSGADEVVLSIRQLLQTEGDVLLEFCLTDNGNNRVKAGSGFRYHRALASAKKLVNEMNGKSELVAIPGLNTTFKFIIRFSLQAEDESASFEPDFDLSGKRILVAEDNEMNQKTIVKLLSEHNVTVDMVGHAREAVDLLERNPSLYNLAMLDMYTPFMDGLQATNYIRKRLKNTVPILLMITGEEEASTSNYNIGVSGTICKPFSTSDLLNKIKCLTETESPVEFYENMKIA